MARDEWAITVERVNVGIAAILNPFVIFLIATKSRKEIGGYKYLLLAFVFCDFIYAVMHVLLEPVLVTRGGVMLIYSRGFLRHRSWMAIYCGTVSTSFMLLAYHFLYRSLHLLKEQFLMKFGQSKAAVALICTLPCVEHLVWGGMLFFFNQYQPKFLPLITDFVAANADDMGNLEDLSTYVGRRSDDGTFELNGILCIGIMSVVLAFTLGVIVFCSVKIVLTLRSGLYSAATYKIQNQLFIALIVQTIVPSILLYAPGGILFMLCFFPGSPIEMPKFYTSLSFSLYPVVDPLVIVLLIADYRRAAIALITRKTPTSPAISAFQSSSVASSQVHSGVPLNKKPYSNTRLSTIVD